VAIVPAVAVKDALLALVAIVTVAGIVSMLAMPPLSVTATGAGAPLPNVTVQMVLPFDVSVPGLHANDVSVAGAAVSARLAICDEPGIDAVSVAL